VNFKDYCANPSKYKNDLAPDVIAYWDTACKDRSDVAKMAIDTDIAKHDDDPTGEKIVQSITLFINLLMTVGGIMMLQQAYKLSGITLKGVKTAMSDWLVGKAPLDAEAIADAEMFADIFPPGLENITMIYRTVVNKISSAAESLSLGKLLGVLGKFLNWLMIAQIVVQFLGQILDTIDPCDLNEMMDTSSFSKLSTGMDSAFRDGKTYTTSDFPLEYFADVQIESRKNDAYKRRESMLMMKYLASLTVNSNGEPLFWTYGGKLVDNNLMARAARTISLDIADNNTVVANLFYRYWPIALAIVIIVIIILFKIK